MRYSFSEGQRGCDVYIAQCYTCYSLVNESYEAEHLQWHYDQGHLVKEDES